MAYRTVCISPTDGSGSELVGPIVAEALGFQLLNTQIVARAAADAGVDTATVVDEERRQSVAARLLGRLTDAGPSGAAGPAGDVDETGPDAEDLRAFIREILREAGERGDAVIVTHAASYALADRADVLRVLISASPESRARRVAEAKGCSESEAATAIARGDAGRADYLKRFYDVDAELPTHYDLVINTDRLDAGAAADLIVSAARPQDD